MTWLKLDDKFAGHPKISPLSDAAFRLHVAGMLYAAQHETDGLIPAANIPTLTPRYQRKHLVELVDQGLWEDVRGGMQIHDFTEYNPSRAEQQAKRAAAKERMAKVRAARNQEAEVA